jgi:ribose transport system permease protein
MARITSSSAAVSESTPAAHAIAQLRRGVGGPVIGLIALVAVMSVLSPYFLTPHNLLNVLNQVGEIGVMAVGEALVLILGGIDLSVGSTLAVSLMVAAWLWQDQHLPFALGVVVGLAVGALVGLVNGLLSTYGKVQPFIATLATMSAGAGMALYVTGGNTISDFPTWFLQLTNGHILGFIPIEDILLLSVFGVSAFYLRARPNGRALYAIGGNEEVARLSGLPIRSMKIRVYVISGLLAGVAGMLVGSRLNSAQPTSGSADLLSVLAAVVIGGASLTGGSGTMFGTLVGLLIIGVVNDGLALLNVSPYLQQVVLGAVIVIAAMTDRARKKSPGRT